MQTIFEKLGGTYRQEGNYLLPNIEVPESPQIGIWKNAAQNKSHGNTVAFLTLFCITCMTTYSAYLHFHPFQPRYRHRLYSTCLRFLGRTHKNNDRNHLQEA